MDAAHEQFAAFSDVIRNELHAGTSIAAMQDNILTPALREVGRMWMLRGMSLLDGGRRCCRSGITFGRCTDLNIEPVFPHGHHLRPVAGAHAFELIPCEQGVGDAQQEQWCL